MQQQADQGATESGTAAWESSVSREMHDDPLLGCLMVIAKMFERPCTAAVTAALPLVDNKLTPTLFIRAAERAGLSARLIKRPLGSISALVLPAILLLANKQACILESITDSGQLRIIQPRIWWWCC